MSLSEDGFAALVDAGCPTCTTRTRLTVEALVAQRLSLLGGELYGSPSWAYKGEDLVRGTYEVRCDGCATVMFEATSCPACDDPSGVSRALQTENNFPLLAACRGCANEQLTALAWVPASVVYEGKRGARARTQTSPEDPGFHVYLIECKSCRRTERATAACSLCGSGRPLARG